MLLSAIKKGGNLPPKLSSESKSFPISVQKGPLKFLDRQLGEL